VSCLIIVRPQPGCQASVEAAQALGLEAHGFPLFALRPLSWDLPDASAFDALLIGSVNALRHGGAAITALQGKPAYAVGDKTAQACREAGLDLVATGAGGLQQVLAQLAPEHGRLLRLAGARRVPLDPPPGVAIVEQIVYASDPLPMDDELAQKLAVPAVIALHSGEAARHLREQCEARNIELAQLSLAAIGPRVAEAAGPGWRAARAAETPSETALLALAAEMCKEADEPQPRSQAASGTRPAPMPDETATPPPAAPLPPPRAPKRSARWLVLLVLLGIALGAAGVGWLASRGYLEDLGLIETSPQRAMREDPTLTPSPDAEETYLTPDSPGEAAELAAISSAEARLAMLEDRLSRLDLQANAASGNAARAESLLIAFAARRRIDRGEPLRYLADQLQLRFANAQPRAVQTIVAFSRDPVTLDELSARLEALSPELSLSSPHDSFWNRAINDLSNLFTVRREPSEVTSPQAGVERARMMLRSGRTEQALEQVRRLPGADAASKWTADAQRYGEVQRALDLIETTAMLEPSRLRDAGGNRVRQSSPLAAPTVSPSPSPSPAPSPTPEAGQAPEVSGDSVI
jgi:uroporphyrinogen-III synthase